MKTAVAPSSTLTLAYDRPFDWSALLAFFRLRAVDGVETVGDASYRRSVVVDGRPGLLTVADDPDRSELVASIEGDEIDVAAMATRLRRMFDLDDDAETALRHLACDPLLNRLVVARPGLRIPGHWQPFETAVRAVLGQQVSLAAARGLAVRLADRAATVFGDPRRDRPYRLFPSPREILDADLSAMGMPGSRVRTLQALAEAALADPDLFRRSDIEETVARLGAIKGIGAWTAHYIALRACREPDAFPASDVGLLRAMAIDGVRPTLGALLNLAERWRPHRAYAAQLIWASEGPADRAK